MNRLIETKNVLKNIAKDIVTKCAAKGQTISSACALRIMKITIQNPEYDFGSDMMTRPQIQQLVATCVAKMTDRVGSSSRTIEMQVYFSSNYTTRDEIVVDHRHNVLSRTEPLIAEIKDTGLVTGDDLKNLYRKLVIAITLLSGLGNPSATSVLKEATAALHSVFPLSELNRFIMLSDEDKMKQIIELKQIVSGIRLFNRDSHKGGEGIDDMPSILQQAVMATRDLLNQGIQDTQEQIDQITAWLNHLYQEKVMEDSETVQVNVNIPPTLAEEDLILLKENAVHLMQYQIYLKTMLEDVKECEKEIVVLCSHVTERLLQLHDTVRYRTAIPTNQVYPQFMDLSITWFSLQDQMIVLSTYNQIIYALQNMSKIHRLSEDKIDSLNDLLNTFTSRISMYDRVQKIQPSKVKCEVLELVNIENCDPKKIQYYGHCAFRFVEMEGSLFPAELSLGLLRYKGFLFAFSSVEAAYTFGRDPERYYQQGLDLVVHRPELIVLFNMDEQIHNLKPTSKTPTSAMIQKCDSQTQTDTHPVEHQLDPSYSWNIWDYKRQAVQLADICKSATRSCQTDHSHKRLHIAVQAKPSRSTGVQHDRHTATNTPAVRSYIVGLRGTWLRDQFMSNNMWTHLPRCPQT
ncbi:cilia- and flagella-associated protein 206-like isoform X2 [Macrosteles quadrilineatus]|nr:cilia- and flagella-associated protein 206-like isoform X2 [Macrosteles quadrilineatus]XP_054262894.1 cilia- and flagella-associated protein 206-like isoform X2 [Macrosteles quadrilineatus]XP_054263060.1 cilia- and flagella-associated protein 206-like isoform X2 [Macrosteles quadrilineatus]XP_054263061.1 cilia- and flagella-associated protein 206-like isoform X2 [Macrosteles quadrilineatus]